MNKTHTSQPLSKLLHDSSCELEFKAMWAKDDITKEWYLDTCGDYGEAFHWSDRAKIWIKERGAVPAYSYYDIIVTHATEFFGREGIKDEVYFNTIKAALGEPSHIDCDFYMREAEAVHTEHILFLLQQGKKQEAEDYFWEHCLFNEKNTLS